MSRYMCRKYRQKLKKWARLDSSSHCEESFVNFMKSIFNLDCISSASTAVGNTCIDLTFTRNISVQTLPYVSYFSYHRPVLNSISSASTTLGNTCIDLTFTRNISVQTLPYVSYFSYHRPVLNRLLLSSKE